jgi:hypothetical protein
MVAVAGCMNTIGNLGGAVTQLVTGYILSVTLADYAAIHDKTVQGLTDSQKAAGLLPGYHINFAIYGFVYVIAVVLWLRVDPPKPIMPEAQQTEPLAT